MSCLLPSNFFPDVSERREIDIVVVDDHPAIRSAIRHATESAGGMEVAGETGSAMEAIQMVEELEPAVATIDLFLPDGHGLDLINDIRSRCPDTRMVVFSMYDEKVYAARALQAGASGYLMKATPGETLLEAVRQVYRGEVYLTDGIKSRILSRMVENEGGEAHFSIDKLTNRELQVFQMMGQGLTTDKIADRLSLARKTVETYRRNAKEKFGLDSILELRTHATHWTVTQSLEEGEKKRQNKNSDPEEK